MGDTILKLIVGGVASYYIAKYLDQMSKDKKETAKDKSVDNLSDQKGAGFDSRLPVPNAELMAMAGAGGAAGAYGGTAATGFVPLPPFQTNSNDTKGSTPSLTLPKDKSLPAPELPSVPNQDALYRQQRQQEIDQYRLKCQSGDQQACMILQSAGAKP